MRVLKITLGMLSLIFIIGVGLFLVPINYDVEPFKEIINTEYWTLRDGSKIGYTKIESTNTCYENPIIYLHGGPGGNIKDEIIEAYETINSKEQDIYFYDQIGSGHSDRLEHVEEYTVNRHTGYSEINVKRFSL